MSTAALTLPDGLHPTTAALVVNFATVLASKLHAAEAKRPDMPHAWTFPGWLDEARVALLEHVAKGDPVDVAAYCAFLWHHGEPTAKPAFAERVPWLVTMAGTRPGHEWTTDIREHAASLLEAVAKAYRATIGEASGPSAPVGVVFEG